MDKAYFQEYEYLERNHWWFKVRSSILKQYINSKIYKKSKLKILNIGSATGATSEWLMDFGDVQSIEYDRDCSVLSSRNKKLSIINSSITSIPFKSSQFDLVCAFDVIEHVENDINAVLEMNRVCKKGGDIFLTVPAYEFLWSQHDEVNEHFRRYNRTNLIQLVNGVRGNEIIFLSYFNSILFPFISLFRLLSKIIPKEKLRNGAGSDFTIVNNNSLINKVLYSVFYSELFFLKHFRFPFGVSLMLHSKKY